VAEVQDRDAPFGLQTRQNIAAGAKVVVASRKSEACAEAQTLLRSLDGEALGVPAHLGQLDDLDTLVSRTVGAFGAVDVVVNNAANALSEPVVEQTPEAWAKSFEVNLRGPVFLTQKALPHLIASSPHAAVLNAVSVGAFLFSPYILMYSAGKAALMSYTRSMAAEFALHGVRVNALAPGYMNTDMTRANPPERQEAMANACLQKRIAETAEMIGPAMLLTSDAGSFITGQVLIADGGMTPR
jgi:NAD(P)-dependent dehydrogenase (short-subunit alcohol dehydrogenase family)